MGIKNVLKKLDRNLRWLAKETQIPYSTLSDLANNKSDIDNWYIDNLYKISNVLGITMDKTYKIIKDDGENVPYHAECYYANKLLQAKAIPDKNMNELITEIELLNNIIHKLVINNTNKEHELNNLKKRINIIRIVKVRDEDCLWHEFVVKKKYSSNTKPELIYPTMNIKEIVAMSKIHGLTIDELVKVFEIQKMQSKVNGQRYKSSTNKLTRDEAKKLINRHNYHKRRTTYLHQKDFEAFFNGDRNVNDLKVRELMQYAECFNLTMHDTYSFFVKNGLNLNLKFDRNGQYQFDLPFFFEED